MLYKRHLFAKNVSLKCKFCIANYVTLHWNRGMWNDRITQLVITSIGHWDRYSERSKIT